MYRRIMVPLDGSSFGDYALPAAVALARRTGAMLDLVHVHRPLGAQANYSADPGFEHVTELYRDLDAVVSGAEHDRMRKVADELRRTHAVDVMTIVLYGDDIAATLFEHAAESSIDFVIMSSHGQGGTRPFGVGSVASRLVRDMEVPVLVMRPDSDAPNTPDVPAFRHVLVPLDGSPRSEDVIPAARELAYPFASDVTLLQVVQHGLWPINVIEVQQLDVHRKERAHRYLSAVADRIRGLWADPGLAVAAHESVPDAILQAADGVGADLVAMATHGRAGLSRLVMGSVAAEVLRSTRLPLLLFGPAAADRRRAEHEAAERAIEAFSI
jgi:nucleotide-binding universal stress UspA family protein